MSIQEVIKQLEYLRAEADEKDKKAKDIFYMGRASAYSDAILLLNNVLNPETSVASKAQ